MEIMEEVVVFIAINTAGDIPKMINCTVANNQVLDRVNEYGGDLHHGQSLTQEMYNTIVWHNDPQN